MKLIFSFFAFLFAANSALADSATAVVPDSLVTVEALPENKVEVEQEAIGGYTCYLTKGEYEGATLDIYLLKGKESKVYDYVMPVMQSRLYGVDGRVIGIETDFATSIMTALNEVETMRIIYSTKTGKLTLAQTLASVRAAKPEYLPVYEGDVGAGRCGPMVDRTKMEKQGKRSASGPVYL
jgi:hypothetical protein